MYNLYLDLKISVLISLALKTLRLIPNDIKYTFQRIRTDRQYFANINYSITLLLINDSKCIRKTRFVAGNIWNWCFNRFNLLKWDIKCQSCWNKSVIVCVGNAKNVTDLYEDEPAVNITSWVIAFWVKKYIQELDFINIQNYTDCVCKFYKYSAFRIFKLL